MIRDRSDDARAIWVGMLDLDGDAKVAEVAGLLGPTYTEARILIRVHGAPLGHVQIGTAPADTLAERARATAEKSLAKTLAVHNYWDSHPEQANGRRAEVPWASCPRSFPESNGTGVTVAVCTRDRTADLVNYCLPALQNIRYQPLEILVVDNAPSSDATVRAVTELSNADPRIKYVCEPVQGLSVARNRALACAKFDVVAFTDDDATPEAGWVTAIVAGFTLDAAAVCVTGLLIPAVLDTGYQRYFEARYSWGEAFEPRRYDLQAHRHPSHLYPFQAGIFGAGANFAVRRQAVLDVGGFDPMLGAGGLGRGGEDLDMFLRLILAGGRIDYVPSAIVFHRHRPDMQSLREQLYCYGHGLGAYLAKHMGNRDLRTALRSHALHQSKLTLGRIREASKVSQVHGKARSLVLAEMRGLMTGAVRYRRAMRPTSQRRP